MNSQKFIMSVYRRKLRQISIRLHK